MDVLPTLTRTSLALLATMTLGHRAQAEIIVPNELPLGAAISLAADGETITIMPGVYDGSQGFAITNKRLNLRGSSGNPADTIIDGFHVGRILEISGAGASGTVLEGLTLRNGSVTPVSGNSAGGGGVFVNGCSVTIANCVFEGHAFAGTSAGEGGAVFSTNGSLTVLDSVFTDNSAMNAGSDGGAVCCWGSGSHLFRDCYFSGNATANTGGAVRVDTGSAQLTRCTFETNAAGGDPDVRGGAFFARGGAQIAIDACTFLGNTSSDQGGAIGILDTSTHVTVRNSVFRGNVSSSDGGAINSNGTFSISSCTFEGNSSGTCAVLCGSMSSVATIDNTIIWNNEPGAGQLGGTGSITVRYSLVQGGVAGPGNLDVDPMFVDAGAGNLAVQAGSPAIDAGNTSLYAGPFVDLAGGDRATDDPGTVDTGLAIAGPVIDMGAYELAVGPVSTCPADVVSDGTVDALDFLAIIAAWGACP